MSLPIPKYLEEKLKKRGISLNNNNNSENFTNEENSTLLNEISTKSDDLSSNQYNNNNKFNKQLQTIWLKEMKQKIQISESIDEFIGYHCCPNKYNIYHRCTFYCIRRWGDGILKPNEKYLMAKSRLLLKYPLPENWSEIYDYGSGVHYYWNFIDDLVSWLPPIHPKAHISISAAELRRELSEITKGN